MKDAAAPDTYQLAGLDDRERGFSRPAVIQATAAGFQARLTYERHTIVSEVQATGDQALHLLIATLHHHGFRQLKTQMSFRGGVYLGSQELWVEYPDPPPEVKARGVLSTIASWFRRSAEEQGRT